MLTSSRALLAWPLLLCVLASSLGMSSCLVGVDTQTRQILQGAIDELGKQPDRWQSTLTNSIDELGRVGTQTAKDVLAEVTSVYNNALGQTLNATLCGADFFGLRVQQKLQAILHKIDSNAPAPIISPVVCMINANQIEPGKTHLVVYNGFDFSEFNKSNSFTADLVYGTGEVVKPNVGFVTIPHNYQLELSLDSVDWAQLNLDRTRGPKVVLKWGDAAVARKEGRQSELPILMEAAPPPQIVLTGARASFFTTDDNKDFDTRVSLQVTVGGATVASLSDTWGEFRDNTDSGWKVLSIQEQIPKDKITGTGKVQLVEAPVGHDEWHFNWRLELTFSDGSTKVYDFPGGNVDYDRTTLNYELQYK